MQLFYYQRAAGNIGDDLNAWLWPKEVPRLEEITAYDHLIGIGTILDERLDSLQGRKLICGSGYRPGSGPPIAGSDWTFGWVRGPRTAEAYGLPEEAYLTDGALLISDHVDEPHGQRDEVGFIPHFYSMEMLDCESLCESAGLRFISPEWEVERFVEAMLNVDRVVAEAMHGAIIADALGIPWVRLRAMSWAVERSEVSDFKWDDWRRSMGITDSAQIDAPTVLWSKKGVRTVNRALSVVNKPILRRVLREARDSTLFTVSDRDRRVELGAKMRARLDSMLS